MTPKEKAQELVEKYFNTCHKSSDLELSWKVCKLCALIALDEMIELCESYMTPYYEEVKKEIDKL